MAERLWRRVSRLTCAQQDSVSKATYGTGTATWWQYSTLESNYLCVFMRIFKSVMGVQSTQRQSAMYKGDEMMDWVVESKTCQGGCDVGK